MEDGVRGSELLLIKSGGDTGHHQRLTRREQLGWIGVGDDAVDIWLSDNDSPPDMSRSSSSRNACSPGLGGRLSGAFWSRGSVTMCRPSTVPLLAHLQG